MSRSNRVAAALVALAGFVYPAALQGQAEGAVAGRVYDAHTGASLHQAQILVDDRTRGVADTGGVYRVRAVRSGWHRVAGRMIGYRSVVHDSVFVRAGATVTVDFPLETNPLELAPLVVTVPVDPVLDPLATATEQKIRASDLRELPVSSLEEALALSAGSVGESYRGGRLGEESFILDGLGVKNQLDASQGGLGPANSSRCPERGLAGDERLLCPLRPGLVRVDQRRHQGARGRMGRPPRLRDRPAIRRKLRTSVWIASLPRPGGRWPAGLGSWPAST